MIFNLHSQFERLRAEGRFETIRDTTIGRDVALNGSAKSRMLAIRGKGSAAAQYRVKSWFRLNARSKPE